MAKRIEGVVTQRPSVGRNVLHVVSLSLITDGGDVGVFTLSPELAAQLAAELASVAAEAERNQKAERRVK